MPKLLSRSKHKEFKSNSSLQIRSQKERRAKSEEKWSIAKLGSCSTVHPTAPVLLHFTLLLFLLQFFVSSHFVLIIAFSFSFFFFFL